MEECRHPAAPGARHVLHPPPQRNVLVRPRNEYGICRYYYRKYI